ncbi:hypothetical protein D9Y22_16780 [Methylorubrum sp. DB1722]|nr:hypothetical protein [Methylorubrum sp. DB1722]
MIITLMHRLSAHDTHLLEPQVRQYFRRGVASTRALGLAAALRQRKTEFSLQFLQKRPNAHEP